MNAAPLRQFVLGTVQLGLPYGRRADQPIPTRATAEAVLDSAWQLGIRSFDTAAAYGEASDRLACWVEDRGLADQLEVITKVPPHASTGDVLSALRPFVAVERRLVLTHGAASAVEWQEFSSVVAESGASAGQSVYTADEVAAASAAPEIVRIQAPGNLFDGAALRARGGAPVPLDLRSVYLQGVLLDPPEQAERRAPGAGMLARAIADAARSAGHEAAALLVAAMLGAIRPSDRLVIGVDAPDQLETLRRALTISAATVDRFEQEVAARLPLPASPRVLDPRSWSTVVRR